MSLESYISTYGYLALFLGAILEGESFVLVGGFLAHEGYLQLPWVMIVAAAGAFSGDQIFFHLGRRSGFTFIKKHHWKRRAERVRKLLERYQAWVVIGFRFLYGLRIATPIVIGLTGYSAIRFLILNAIGAMLWAGLVGTAGYLFGNLVTPYLEHAKSYRWWIVLGVIGFWSLMWLGHRILTKREEAREKAQRAQAEESPENNA